MSLGESLRSQSTRQLGQIPSVAYSVLCLITIFCPITTYSRMNKFPTVIGLQFPTLFSSSSIFSRSVVLHSCASFGNTQPHHRFIIAVVWPIGTCLISGVLIPSTPAMVFLLSSFRHTLTSYSVNRPYVSLYWVSRYSTCVVSIAFPSSS